MYMHFSNEFSRFSLLSSHSWVSCLPAQCKSWPAGMAVISRCLFKKLQSICSSSSTDVVIYAANSTLIWNLIILLMLSDDNIQFTNFHPSLLYYIDRTANMCTSSHNIYSKGKQRNNFIVYIDSFVEGKGKGIPLQAWEVSWGSRRLRLLDLLDTRHMKVVRSSPLFTSRLHPQEVPGTHFFRGWVDSGAHGFVEASEKILSETTGDRSRDRPTSSALS
jgi:hypothetical protein